MGQMRTATVTMKVVLVNFWTVVVNMLQPGVTVACNFSTRVVTGIRFVRVVTMERVETIILRSQMGHLSILVQDVELPTTFQIR